AHPSPAEPGRLNAAYVLSEQLTYPPSPRSDHADLLFGREVPDPYRWLEDATDPRVGQWIGAQNSLTDPVLTALPLRGELRDRIVDLWNFPKYGVPVRVRNRYFYLENSGVQNQPVLYYRDGLNGRATVLIDPNTFASDGSVSLTLHEPSPNANLMAYGVSRA